MRGVREIKFTATKEEIEQLLYYASCHQKREYLGEIFHYLKDDTELLVIYRRVNLIEIYLETFKKSYSVANIYLRGNALFEQVFDNYSKWIEAKIRRTDQ